MYNGAFSPQKEGDTVLHLIAGIDEAGRGALAGPVVASCVILPPYFLTDILDDSKRLSPTKRRNIAALLKGSACYGVGQAGEKLIDQENILRATFCAMKAAFDIMQERLPQWLKFAYSDRKGERISLDIIVDGNALPFKVDDTSTDATLTDVDEANIAAVVKADSFIPSVQAASIIAKVARDELMVRYGAVYPGWGYEKHKGYPTRAHKEALSRLGPSPIQRLTFKW